MWSEPIYVQAEDGREIAVILLDTQGLFNDESPTNHNQLLFGLSALISSVFIYNVQTRMTQKDWDVLNLLMNFNNFTVNHEPE